jgi:GT2 family glycosyltransferase
MAVSQKETPQLSIIIINYQTDKLVLDLVRKLKGNSQTEIIVVDNSPQNSLQSKIGKRLPYIKYYFTGKNLGFAGGNNYGIRRSRGEWVLLLNSDTSTSLPNIHRLLGLTIASNALVSAPRLIDADGKVQDNVGYFDGPFRQPLSWLLARPRFLNCALTAHPTTVDLATGALATGAVLLVNRSVFDHIGLLDEHNYFMYFEDIDFSLRLHRVHIQVLYIPQVTVIHFGGRSSDQDAKQKNLNYYQGLHSYITKHRGYIVDKMNSHFNLFN